MVFGMLDTSNIFSPSTPLWSHNIFQNCDHASFNIDCFYGILQNLLRVCMTTKVSFKCQSLPYPISLTGKIFYDR
jgi:hypothetical protein